MKNAIEALEYLALAAQPSNETMEAVRTIRAAIAGMQWQPIKTAPKDATPVDLWASNEDGGYPLSNYKRVCLSKGNTFYDPVAGGICCVRCATHWRPRPLPPESET